jgi:hypothetical protein
MSVIITLGKRQFVAEFECPANNISPISPHSNRFRFGTGLARHMNKMAYTMVK